jgi:hypothetical protein
MVEALGHLSALPEYISLSCADPHLIQHGTEGYIN